MASNERVTCRGIKRIFFLFTVCFVAMASAKVVGPVPLGESLFVDTEVSTNVPAPACGVDPHRTGFTLEFAGSPSNAVEVAFGIDANSDGALTPDEASLVIGWECGAWFIRNENDGDVFTEPATTATGPQALYVSMRAGRSGRISSFLARSGNTPLFVGLASAPPSWLHDCAWNRCRFTARGVDGHNASFLVSATPDGMSFIFR